MSLKLNPLTGKFDLTNKSTPQTVLDRVNTSAERLKAAQVPVAGALVIAPLCSTYRNYGSLGGSFVVHGSPVQCSRGTATDGVSALLHLVTGNFAEFTCTFRSRMPIAVDNYACVIVGGSVPGDSTYRGWGLSHQSSAGNHIAVNVVGVAIVQSTLVDDGKYHTYTIERAAGNMTLYIDGVSAASTALGTATGTAIIIGGTPSNPLAGLYSVASVANLVYYGSALSDASRAAVEAWAERELTEQIIPENDPTVYIAHNSQPWNAHQLEEPCVFVDPTDATKLVQLYTGNAYFNQSPSLGRATASVSDPLIWVQDVGNPVLALTGSYRLDSVVVQNGVVYAYVSAGPAGIKCITSTDAGKTWTERGNVLLPSGDETHASQGAVLVDDDGTVLTYYSYRTATGTLQGVRLATSSSLLGTRTKVPGNVYTVQPGTPASTYIEWHQILKIDGVYILICETYDGQEFSINAMYSTNRAGPFTLGKKNPLYNLSLNHVGYHVATPAMYQFGGKWYLFGQKSTTKIGAVGYMDPSVLWDMFVVEMPCSPLGFR